MLLLHLTGSISILLGFTSALSGPKEVHGFVGRSIPVKCHYDPSYQTYLKYWCKGDSWSSCKEVVKTTGSEAEMKADRTSIKDNHTCSCFTVTLEDLREEDAGLYWCAIERPGYNPHTHVTVILDYSSTLTGPKEVRAILGSSVSVVCSYDQRYQQNEKYWCRRMSGNCQPIIRTRGSEVPVVRNRVSIQDNHSLNHFTVRMEDLTRSDSGAYSCSLTRAGGSDVTAPVNVTVLSSPQMTNLSNNQDHGGSFRTTNSISYQIYVPFLVLICLKTPIFLTMVLAVIWMHRKNRQHADEVTAPETQP